jgi:hypothetical protein
VYMTHPNFTFTAATATTTAPNTSSSVTSTSTTTGAVPRLLNDNTRRLLDDSTAILPTPLPLCTLDHEALDHHNGRWVRAPFPNSTVCPNAMSVDQDFRNMFDIVKFDATHPHCWHRDDFSNIGNRCIEMNCPLITQQSKWRSEVHEEKQFYGVWQPYACDYVEFTDAQLQTCITSQKISSIETRGASIASYLGQYLGLRLKNIAMYNKNSSITGQSEKDDSRSVILSTLALLHKMSSPDDLLARAILTDKSIAPPTANKDMLQQDVYWVIGFFLSSERCDHCHMSRMNMTNHVASQTLQEAYGAHGQHYKMINAFDMSAAFTYDTATQFDGMHIIGPVRMVHYYKKNEQQRSTSTLIFLTRNALTALTTCYEPYNQLLYSTHVTDNEDGNYKTISSHVQGQSLWKPFRLNGIVASLLCRSTAKCKK